MYKRSDKIIYEKIFSSFDTVERPYNFFCARTSRQGLQKKYTYFTRLQQ